jgi:hypothetical protein
VAHLVPVRPQLQTPFSHERLQQSIPASQLTATVRQQLPVVAASAPTPAQTDPMLQHSLLEKHTDNHPPHAHAPWVQVPPMHSWPRPQEVAASLTQTP